MKLLLKILLPLIVIGFGIYMMIFLKSFRKAPMKRQTPERVVSMFVTKATYSQVTPTISVLARVRAKDRVNLASETSGKIEKTAFKLRKGTQFKKGDILLKINDETAKNTLKVQISNLMSGVGEMIPDMKVDIPGSVGRWQNFFKNLTFNNIPPLPGYQSEKEKMYLTRFNIFKLYYSTRNQLELVNKYIIKAPFNGLVANSRVHPGDLANPGANLGTLISIEKYELELPLTQSELSLVNRGMKVNVVISENGYKTSGTIVRLSPVLDDVSQTAIAIVEVRGNRSIVDGAYGKMIINGKELSKAIVIPRQALYQDNYALVIGNVKSQNRQLPKHSKKSIKTKDSKKMPNIVSKPPSEKSVKVGTMEIRTVKAAFIGRDYAYITEGIDEGELVVIEPTQNVAGGMKVTPVIKPNTKG